MKKFFIAQIAVLATVILTAASCVRPEPQTSIQTISVAEYELKRAALYDAALNLCMEASKGAYVWDEYVSAENKRIILTYRVPSLEVLLSAIEQMDSDGCLCDSFDEPLCRFDKAFYEYSKIAKIN